MVQVEAGLLKKCFFIWNWIYEISLLLFLHSLCTGAVCMREAQI